jgi:hypothetical protein
MPVSVDGVGIGEQSGWQTWEEAGLRCADLDFAARRKEQRCLLTMVEKVAALMVMPFSPR